MSVENLKYFGSDALNKLIDLVKTALGLKADDSNVVHKTGNETIGGEKSFSDRTTIQKTGSDTPLLLKGSSDTSWIAFATASGDISNPMGYIGVKSDNKPYFYNSGAKRLALLEETLPVFGSNDVSSNDCNTWTAKGVYQGLNATNSPVTGWITVVTIPAGNENANYCEQRLFVTASNDVYSRYRSNGTWSSWININSVNKIDNSNSCLKNITGSGSYNYCLLATLTITSNYINFPIAFRIFGRGYAQTNLQIRFKSENNNDPALDAFVTDNSDQFRLYKSATSTWQLYGMYSDNPWGAYAIDRVVGSVVNAGITVTINGTNVSSIPSGASSPILRVGWNGSAGINGGIDPDHCNNLATMKNTGTWEAGVSISQEANETSGIHMDGANIKMWSPCDDGSLIYYDEDNGNEVWRVDDAGCLVGGMADPTATSNKVWFGKDSNGKWGYKTSKTGTVTPFRNPTGTATAGKVLRGYTFSNATSDGISGTYDPLLEAYDPSDTSFTNYYVPKNSTYDITVPKNYILIIEKSTSLSISVVTSGTAGLIKEYSNSIYVYVSYSSSCKIRLTNNYSYAYNIIYAILRIT